MPKYLQRASSVTAPHRDYKIITCIIIFGDHFFLPYYLIMGMGGSVSTRSKVHRDRHLTSRLV